MSFQFPADHDASPMLALRRDILDSPISVGLARAEAFTSVWQSNQGAPWIVKKAMAFREYFRMVPLYLRANDLLAGAISEAPGAIPLMVELGIAEESLYVNEQPNRSGYLAGKVPRPIMEYWEDRNLWGHYRAYMRTVEGKTLERTQEASYKFLSDQGHLSPSYRELLSVGLDGMMRRIRERRVGEIDPASLEFLVAAEYAMLGLQEWIERYARFLDDEGDAMRQRNPIGTTHTKSRASQPGWHMTRRRPFTRRCSWSGTRTRPSTSRGTVTRAHPTAWIRSSTPFTVLIGTQADWMTPSR